MQKKIRLFHALGAYPDIIKIAYIKNRKLQNDSYENQTNAIFDAGYGSLNIWKLYFENSDSFEFGTCICNAQIAQLKWATEQGKSFTGREKDKRLMQDILIEQISIFKPDILFAHDISLFEDILDEIKQKVKSIKLIFGWDGILMHSLTKFRNFDLILSPVKQTVEYYQNEGKLAYFFPFGFHEKILSFLKPTGNKYNCSFIGQLNPKGQHSERFENIVELSKNYPMSLWVPSLGFQNWKSFYYHQMKRIIKLDFNEYFDVNRLKRLNIGSVYGLDMFQKISESKMTINKHINHVGNAAANIRLFETTGVGSCLITDYKENIHEYFDTEKEIVTYNSKEELISKVLFYSKNETARQKIAEAGQIRTLRDHSYSKRFVQFNQSLKELI